MRTLYTLLALLLLSSFSIHAQTLSWHQTGGPEGGDIAALAMAPGGALIAGSAHGIYRSMDEGRSWVRNPFVAASVGTLARAAGRSLFAGTDRGLYLSSDGGSSWELVGFGGEHVRIFSPGEAGLLFVSMESLDGDMLFRSTDGGTTWSAVPFNDFFGRPFRAMTIDRRGVLFSTGGYGIARSTDSGRSWQIVEILMAVPEGGTPPLVSIIADTAGTILAGTDGGMILRSTDRGESWTRQTTFGAASFLVTSAGNVLAGTTGRGVMRSTDGGTTWQQLGLESRNVRALAEGSGGGYFAGTKQRGIFASDENGEEWSERNSGIVATVVHSIFSRHNQTIEGFQLAATDGGIFRTDTHGDNWRLTAFDGETVTILAGAEDGMIYAGGMEQRAIAMSADNGGSWDRMEIRGNSIGGVGGTSGIRAIAPGQGSLLLVAARGNDYGFGIGEVPGDLYRTDDYGATWENVIPHTDIHAIVHRSQDIVAAGDGVFRSTDNGLTWEKRDAGLPLSRVSALLALQSGDLLAATADSGIYRSSDDGLSWSKVASFPGGHVTTMTEWRSRVYAATAANGIFSASPGLSDWQAENQGLWNGAVLSLVAGENGLYAGTNGAGVFRSEGTTGVCPVDAPVGGGGPVLY